MPMALAGNLSKHLEDLEFHTGLRKWWAHLRRTFVICWGVTEGTVARCYPESEGGFDVWPADRVLLRFNKAIECLTFRRRSDAQGFEVIAKEACPGHEGCNAFLRLYSVPGHPCNEGSFGISYRRSRLFSFNPSDRGYVFRPRPT